MLPETFLKREILHASHALRSLQLYFNTEISDEQIGEMIANGDPSLPYGLGPIEARRMLLVHAKDILNRNVEIPEDTIA